MLINVKKITISYPLTPEQMEQFRRPQAMALGYFDGVHLGHQQVIGGAVAYARAHGIPASVMTFHPKPREVLRKEKHSNYITPLSEKLEVMARLGVDQLFVVRFDEAFSHISPTTFVEEFLTALEVKHAVVGFDYAFGYKGEGNPEMLRELGKGQMTVDVIQPWLLSGLKVSSTLIRKHLSEGEVEEANRLLGRPYTVHGTVIAGEGRGNTIGYPTANVDPTDAYLIPCNGVYAIQVYLSEKKYDGVMNIGVKPTFHKDGMKQTLEAHLFDFNEDIYGEQVRIEFIEYIRPEQRFSSVQELIAQIHRDADTVRAILASK